MADEQESAEHGDEGEVEVDIESFDNSKNTSTLIRRNKGQWSTQEIKIFEKGLELFGHKWTKIADLLETRTAAQVKSFSRKFLKQKEMDDSSSLILISALTSSQLHLKMEETNEEVNVDDSSPDPENIKPLIEVSNGKLQRSEIDFTNVHNNNCISVPDITKQPKLPDTISLHENKPDASLSPTRGVVTANSENNASEKEAVDSLMINRNTNADSQALSVSSERTGGTSNDSNFNIENCISNNAFAANSLKTNDAKDSNIELIRTTGDDFCDSKTETKEIVPNGSDACIEHGKDSANSCEAIPEDVDNGTMSRELLTEESKIYKLLGLDRSALDPVVSVEKLGDRGNLSEQSNKTSLSNDYVLKTDDSDTKTVLDAYVEVSNINASIKQEPAVELPTTDNCEGKVEPCGGANEERALPDGELANICKSDCDGGNIGIECKTGAIIEAQTAIGSGWTETAESMQPGEHSKSCADEMVREKESTLPCSEHLRAAATNASACASDIIPEDEATKICDALLQTLSPLITDNEPEEKFIVSIKLDKLRKRVRARRAARASTRRLSYATKPHGRLTRRNKEILKTEPGKDITELGCSLLDEDAGRVAHGRYSKSLEKVRLEGAIENAKISSRLNHPKKNECNSETRKSNKSANAKVARNSETDTDVRVSLRDSSDKNDRNVEPCGIDSFDSNDCTAKREDHYSDDISSRTELDNHCDEKRQKNRSKKYKMLPKRTTRHSRPVEANDTPDKLIVSISLDLIDSYCQDEEKPACLLSTHTYSEGWMVQEETLETESKKHFCIDNIFVDKRAFGVMKYRAVGDDGEVKERLEILQSKVAPANYIWPKDEDVRDTERLLVQSVAIEEKQKICTIKEKAVESEKETMENVSSSDGSLDTNQEPAEMVKKPTDSCIVEGVLDTNNAHEEIGSIETCVPISVAKDNVCPDKCHSDDSSNKGSKLKRKVKDTKTKEKNLEKASQNLTAPRKTRSQTARRENETSNEEEIDDDKLESKDNAEPKQISSETLLESKPPPNLDSLEEPVSGGLLEKASHATNNGSVLPDDKKEKMEEDNIDAVSSSLCNDLDKDNENADCELPSGGIGQEEKVNIPQETAQQPPNVYDAKKPGKPSRSKRRKADSSVEQPVGSKKVLRPRRGQYQSDSKSESVTAKDKIVCEDIKENSRVDVIIDGDLKMEKKHRETEDAGDDLKVDCDQGDIAGKSGDIPVLDEDIVKEREAALPFVAIEKNSEAEKVEFQDNPMLEEVSEVKEPDNKRETDESISSALNCSKLPEIAVKCEGDEKPEGVTVDSKSEDDNGYNMKVISKESSIAFSPVQHDSDKSDIDSFQNSPTRFQDDFGEMQPSSVATSIISSMATSLNSELFVMNSCDLEFTLPGMSKDVLVKANGNVVKSNEIEDCLRLPPADEREDIELPQNAGLPCPEGVLHTDIGHRQSLLSSDMEMDCLSSYRDSSKFFGITPGEDTNGDFENVPQRINRDFHTADTFLTSQSADSPFHQSEADVNLKAGDDRSAEDKWDRVLIREPEGLIDKTRMTELVDDPFMNGNELRSSSNPDDSLLTEVENFTENDIANSPCDDGAFDIPDSQFENVDIPTEEFECGQGLVEDPTVNMGYAKETNEVYSSGSSTDEDDEDEDSDSSETDTDSSSSSTSSRSDDDDDDEDDDDDDDDEDDSEEEDSESSDSESDVNEDLRSDEVCLDKGLQGGVPSPSCEAGKEPFATVPIEEVVFQGSEIMPIERKECREFFMGKLSKTPEKYLEIRKFIINEWNKMRPAYLTKNSIRSKVDPTDANAVARVFMFLENIGAINVGCSVKNKWVERMERRRVKYFNAKKTESLDGSGDEPKRKQGRPPNLAKESQEREIFLDFNVITDEEKKANPQFFNGNKNKSPDKYLKMRNSIINCWMDSKPAYLTKQAARMAMSWYCGDVNAISRVHDYLEQTGVINFGCAQEPRRGRPSRGRNNQGGMKPGAKSNDFDVDREATKTANVDSKATRMKNAQKKLEDISREVELEIGKPMSDCDISPYGIYAGSDVHNPNDLNIRKSDDLCLTKPKLKRGRKPKIRQCEPDSTVLDENLLNEKDIITRPPKNGLIPGKEIWESGPASDKSSVGDSGFDSVSEISPLLESDAMIIKPGMVQDVNMSSLEDENDELVNYPMPREEKIIDISMITQEEKLGCPEFFVGSKVKPPEKYVKIRDSILRSWQSKKPFYLNKHNARCDMPWYTGDINSIGRVHAFLERVGAINYEAVHRPKRAGRAPDRKRKLTDSPRYEIPSPETEDDDEMSDKLVESDAFNEDLMTREEREAFKKLLTDGNCVSALSKNRSTVQDVISEMWAKCKQKYVTKTNVDQQYTDDDGEDDNDDDDDDGDGDDDQDDDDDDDDEDDDDDDDDDDDSSSDVVDDTFIGNRALMNGAYSETGKNGVWEMTKTVSLGLRPRKRWKMDINQDWIDRTESEGLTVKHLSPDDDRIESRVRPLGNKFKKSLPESDPYKLVPCRTFPSESAQPFTVTICLKALLVMDFHSHLSSSEVIGLVGGKYYHSSRRLEIMRVAPCSNVGTNLQCEMDPVSQAKASSDLAQHGLDVVGWYHSHPTFAPTPSLRDIDTQSTFQEWFSRAGAPFVGIIISPYNMSNNEVPHRSQITCLTISDQWDESKSYRIPYMFKFKTEDLDKSDSFEDTRDQLKATMQTVEGCKTYLCHSRLGNTPPGLLLLKSFEAKLNRKTSKKEEVLSQVKDLIGI